MANINLLEILKNLDSIRVHQKANSWEEAVKIAIDPLIEKNIVTKDYYDAILKRTKEWGPYYIISDELAMPHAESSLGVNDNGFSLIVLDEPVVFENDPRKIKILIALAAINSDIHTSEALPQIVAVFENNETIKKIINSDSKEEIISIIEKIDFKKYLSK